MHDSAADDGPNLFALLGAVARRASDGQLVTAIAVGLVGSIAIALFAPSLWKLALPCVSLAGFGGWGVAERIGREREAVSTAGRLNALTIVRYASAVIGGFAAAATGVVFTAAMVGRLIS